MEKEHIRIMDDQGKISIPADIQSEMGIKASELPAFDIKVVETEQEKHIGLFKVNGMMKDATEDTL